MVSIYNAAQQKVKFEIYICNNNWFVLLNVIMKCFIVTGIKKTKRYVYYFVFNFIKILIIFIILLIKNKNFNENKYKIIN